MESDLKKDVQSYVVGAQVYKTYWEKRRFLKDEGAAKNWDGYVCTSLIKVPKKNLQAALDRVEKKLNAKASTSTKTQVAKIIKDAKEKF